MIGVIGLGGAGGNIADEAKKRGFLTAAINFSQKDLDAVTVDFKLRLPASEGVGHNRDLAIQLLQNHWKMATDFIQQNFSYTEVVIFAFSTGGGTGSGISPILLDLMSNLMPNTIFVALPILPDDTEVTINQLNTLHVFEELSKLNVAIFPVDNQQITDQHYPISKNRLYKLVNDSTINLIAKLFKYTEEKHSKNGNFDKRDLLTILSTKGIGTISEINIIQQDINIITPGLINDIINKSWSKSIFVPIEWQKVTRSGIIFDADEKYINFFNSKYIFNQFSNGMPIDLFEGYYESDENKIITILTGLSWCNKKLQEIDKLIEKEESKVNIAVNAFDNEVYYQAKNSNLINTIRANNHKEKTITEILNGYRNNTQETEKRSVVEILNKYKR